MRQGFKLTHKLRLLNDGLTPLPVYGLGADLVPLARLERDRMPYEEGYVGFSTEVRMSPKPLSHAQVGFEPTFCDKPQFLPLELFER